ncbi:MAG: hypothetical protein JWQ13_982 [Ramlibacter sp.]|nr:hypothetical protein [Ramlibacter sp.]
MFKFTVIAALVSLLAACSSMSGGSMSRSGTSGSSTTGSSGYYLGNGNDNMNGGPN